MNVMNLERKDEQIRIELSRQIMSHPDLGLPLELFPLSGFPLDLFPRLVSLWGPFS